MTDIKKVALVAPVVQEECNTTKQPKRYRYWCGTTFNYGDKEIALIKFTFKEYVIGKEICPKTKKKHLQWYGALKDGKSMRTMLKIFHPHHIEIAKNNKAALNYCKKDFDYETNIEMKIPLEVIGVHPLYDWQEEIIRLIKEKKKRKINWFWEEPGKVGKSDFARDLFLLGRTRLIEGPCKKSDIAYSLKNGGEFDCVIVDIPREDRNDINYSAMEKILDGIIFSSKYESGAIAFKKPVLIVLCNYPPDKDGGHLSKDRWNIYEIGKKIIPRT